VTTTDEADLVESTSDNDALPLKLDWGTEVKLIRVRSDEVLAIILPPGRRWEADLIRSMEWSWRQAGAPCNLVVFKHGTKLLRLKADQVDLTEDEPPSP
jgi:hypothetical protein